MTSTARENAETTKPLEADTMKRGRTIHMAAKVGAFFLFLLPMAFLFGCRTPCQEFSDFVCKQFKKKHILCTIAREESRRKTATYRRCRALNYTWEKEGKRQVKQYISRYKAYRDKVGRSETMHRGLQLMEQEQRQFRRVIQKLLRLPIRKTAAPPPPARRKK